MKIYIIKAYWRYEDEPSVVGVADAEHIEDLKNIFIGRHLPVRDSILRFEVDEYELNKC